MLKKLFILILLIIAISGCGKNELKVEVSCYDDFGVTIYKDYNNWKSYSNDHYRKFDNVGSGDYYAKLEWYDSYWETWWSLTSPTLHVGNKPLFTKKEYRIELYVYK